MIIGMTNVEIFPSEPDPPARAGTNVYASIDRFWNEARTTELRRLFHNGLSNNQIAVEMNIRSRNAVIGKLHRLGLTRDNGPGQKQSQAARGIVRRVRAPKAVSVEPQHPKAEAFVRAKSIQVDPAFETDGVTDLDIEFSANRVSLLSSGKDQCRWPAADDGSAAMVCGDPVRSGSYCKRHSLRSFRRPVVSGRGMNAG